MPFHTLEVDGTDYRKCPTLMVLNIGEFLDHPVPDTKWIIPGLVPQGVPQVLASKGGLGKSWLALELCVSVSTGKPFMDYEACTPKGAAYFGLEDSKEVIHKRIRAIVEDFKQRGDWSDQDEVALRKNMVVLAINWDSEAATTYLPDLMGSLADFFEMADGFGIPPGVIILDTLARFSDGDENTVSALRPILTACNRITHTGWTSIMLHHVGKGQDGAKSKDKPSLADRMSTEWVRGSSAIVDNFRGVIQLVGLREDEADKAGLDVDKARAGGYLILGATKTNGTARGEWRLLEQGDTGVWSVPGDAQETLAKLRGAKAVEALNKQIEFLIELFHGTRYGQEPDKTGICNRLSPASKDPLGWFRQNVRRLRNSGMIQKNSYQLTASGLQRVTHVTHDRTTNG